VGCPYKPGDRVFGAAQGTYADKVTVNLDQLIRLPDNVTFDQGAGVHLMSLQLRRQYFDMRTGLFVTWPTSYEALVGRAELKSGE
jgi:NADPH2:quinone reductase